MRPARRPGPSSRVPKRRGSGPRDERWREAGPSRGKLPVGSFTLGCGFTSGLISPSDRSGGGAPRLGENTGPPGPPISIKGAASVRAGGRGAGSSLFSQTPSSGASRTRGPAGRIAPVSALYTRLMPWSFPSGNSGGTFPRWSVFRPAALHRLHPRRARQPTYPSATVPVPPAPRVRQQHGIDRIDGFSGSGPRVRAVRAPQRGLDVGLFGLARRRQFQRQRRGPVRCSAARPGTPRPETRSPPRRKPFPIRRRQRGSDAGCTPRIPPP